MHTTTAQRGIATLKEGALSAGRASSVESYLGEVVEQLASLVDSEQCSILLVDGERLRHGRFDRPRRGVPDRGRRPRDRAGLRSLRGRRLPRARRSSPRTSGPTRVGTASAELARALQLRSCWSVPLRLPRRRRARDLRDLSEPRRSRPTPEQIETVEAYASIVALGLDSVRRKAELAASYESAVLALTSALDVRDDYTGSHSQRDLAPRPRCLRPAWARRHRDRDGRARRRASRRRQARRPDRHPHQPGSADARTACGSCATTR